MALTAGVVSKVSAASTKISMSATAASGGTGPYTQQWYRSTTSGFTPGGGNILAGQTALTLNDTGLIPGTQYYYAVKYTDTGNADATINSALVGVATSNQSLDQNSFAQGPFLGQADQQFNYNTKSAMIDPSTGGNLVSGQAVKIVASAGTRVPSVVECSADSDECCGFICFTAKNQIYNALDKCEIAQKGNVIYLYATGLITRFAQVTLDVTTKGGVGQLVGSSGANIVGFAYDGAPAGGGLIRVEVSVPSFLFA